MQRLTVYLALIIGLLSPASAQAPYVLKTWPALTATGTTASQLVQGIDLHTIQVVVTGSPGSCTANLDGSVDATHWFDLSGGQTCTSNLMFHVTSRSVIYVRGNVTALSAAATATITYEGRATGQ